MAKQIRHSKKWYFAAFATAVICLIILCCALFSRPKSGVQLFPKLDKVSSIQILHPDFRNPAGVSFEGNDLEKLTTLLSTGEYKRNLATGSGMEGTIYHVYGYTAASDSSPTTQIFAFFISDQGKLYLDGDKLFCYTVPDVVLDFFLALDA